MVLQLHQQHQELHFHGGVATTLSPRNLKFCGGALFLTTIPSNISSLQVELDGSSPPPLGLQKFLNLKSGEIYYKKIKKEMSRQGNGKLPKLDLRLNLSPPRPSQEEVESPTRSTTPQATSPLSSCISSENTDLSSPETTSMILAGCPRCLMYVMLAEDDPKCPKCKSTVLLDFLHENNTKKTKKN
ncbi:hypothetical protein ACHQM5_021032 [Ranunculus cassubicifolius]